MKRPKAPIDCPYYQAMHPDKDMKMDEDGKWVPGDGVTLEKLAISKSVRCRKYFLEMTAFRAAQKVS